MKGAGRQVIAANLFGIALSAIPLAASANLVLFDISGQFGSGDTFDGTMTVDTAGNGGDGAITMFDVDVDNASITDGFYSVTNVEGSGSGAQSILEIDATNGVGSLPFQLTLAVSFTLSSGVPSSLGGFTTVVSMGTPATIISGSVFNPNIGQFIETNATGSIAVPEPGVLALLGLGLAGLATSRRRKQ